MHPRPSKGGGCFEERVAPTACEYLTYFADERSEATPDQTGKSPGDRDTFGGAIEVYADADAALDRGAQLERKYKAFSDIPHAIYTAGPVVLQLGLNFLGRVGTPYVGEDYRRALEKRYGPVTVAETYAAQVQTPSAPRTPPS